MILVAYVVQVYNGVSKVSSKFKTVSKSEIMPQYQLLWRHVCLKLHNMQYEFAFPKFCNVKAVGYSIHAGERGDDFSETVPQNICHFHQDWR